jgi:hypothetical protein
MTNDFVEYWAAARLFVSGGNPYGPAELFKTQQAIGWSEPSALLMWNPPWTLSFIWPLGLLDYDSAQFIWFLAHTLMVFIGAQLLWRMYDGPSGSARSAWFAVLTFAPVYFVLLLGQIGPVIFLGILVFLLALERQRWAVAGIGLALISLKPHLLYLFWLALLFWLLREKRWRVLWPMAAGGALALVFPLLLNREIYVQYIQMFSSPGIVRPQQWATPSLATAFAAIFAVDNLWLRAIPGLAGFLWLMWYWRSRADHWNWLEQLPLLLLVSVTTAGFVWTFDLVVLLPALIQCAAWLAKRQAYDRHKALLFGYAAINIFLIVGKFFVRNDLWYFWAAPAFLLLYLLLRRDLRLRAQSG